MQLNRSSVAPASKWLGVITAFVLALVFWPSFADSVKAQIRECVSPQAHVPASALAVPSPAVSINDAVSSESGTRAPGVAMAGSTSTIIEGERSSSSPASLDSKLLGTWQGRGLWGQVGVIIFEKDGSVGETGGQSRWEAVDEKHMVLINKADEDPRYRRITYRITPEGKMLIPRDPVANDGRYMVTLTKVE